MASVRAWRSELGAALRSARARLWALVGQPSPEPVRESPWLRAPPSAPAPAEGELQVRRRNHTRPQDTAPLSIPTKAQYDGLKSTAHTDGAGCLGNLQRWFNHRTLPPCRLRHHNHPPGIGSHVLRLPHSLKPGEPWFPANIDVWTSALPCAS